MTTCSVDGVSIAYSSRFVILSKLTGMDISAINTNSRRDVSNAYELPHPPY